MVSAIREEDGKGEGVPLQQQHDYNNYLRFKSSAYSLFVLAIRSPQTEHKYLEIWLLDFAQVSTENEASIEKRCNKLA